MDLAAEALASPLIQAVADAPIAMADYLPVRLDFPGRAGISDTALAALGVFTKVEWLAIDVEVDTCNGPKGNFLVEVGAARSSFVGADRGLSGLEASAKKCC
jgi:hypothetical protein